MPLILPSVLKTESERPHGRSPWIWLVDLELEKRTKTLPAVVLRINSSDDLITWPPGDPSPEVFYPLQFSMSEIEQTNEGDLPTVDLAIDNTARTLMRFLHSGRGFEGNRATVWLTSAAALATADQFLRFDFVVASAIASEQVVSIRLEQPNFFQIRVPASRFVARRCRWEFGGPECGYPVTNAAAYTTCGKTIDDCILRGEDEAFRALPVLHPRRFGGFPGIPAQRGPL